MIYEGVSFNAKAVLKYANADAFCNSISNQHLWKKVTLDIRKSRLMEVFLLIKAIHDANSSGLH